MLGWPVTIRFVVVVVVVVVVCLFVCFVCLFCFVVVCLFVCLKFIVPLERSFLLIRRRHHYRWRASNFDRGSVLIAIEPCGFFNVPHLLWLGQPFIMVVSDDLWHSHLLASVWQCHNLSVNDQASLWVYVIWTNFCWLTPRVWEFNLNHAIYTQLYFIVV